MPEAGQKALMSRRWQQKAFSESVKKRKQSRMTTAAEQRERQFAAFREQRKQEEQERIDRVIAEFDGDLHAMAQEILRYRQREERKREKRRLAEVRADWQPGCSIR
jgi:hypothetical protein